MIPSVRGAIMKKFNLITLGNRIHSARAYKKLTQNYICNKLGISQALLSKIENGKVDISISLLYQISDVLDVSIAWLIGENNIVSDLTDTERLELQEYKKFIINKRKK